MEKKINGNKTLIVSHIADPDGMGSIILGKLAFEDIDYLLIEAKEQREALDFIKENNNYEQIYICDIPLLNEIGDEINDLNLNILHFDHHGTNTYVSKYPFSTVLVEDKEGKTCGTKLFYKHLLKNNYLKDTKAINRFVDLTNDYDTWLWKEKNNFDAAKQTTLFDVIGFKDYIERVVNKLKNETEYTFTEDEQLFIKYREQEINELINNCNKSIIKIKMEKDFIGVLFINRFQSIVGNSICELNKELDYIMMIDMVNKKVSLRSKEFDVSKVASSFGGGGHKLASGFTLTDEIRNKIFKLIIKDK